MPTRGRRRFVELALRQFALQDYLSRELIIIDDGPDSIEDLVKDLGVGRYLRAKQRLSIGAKRNWACQEARGEFIAHWDDDDWYASDRLGYQLAPLITNCADLTGLVNSFVLQLPGGICWTTSRELHRRMFKGDVHGGTLVYRKALFDQGARYPNVNLAEDAGFIQQALAKRQRLLQLANDGRFVYMRHGSNAWQFEAGRFLDPRGWKEIIPPAGLSTAMVDEYRLAAEALTDSLLQPVPIR
jgi:glycosyltransferase involved in cell wall biosynthesis